MLEMDKRYICENCGEPVEHDLPELNWPNDDVELCRDCRDPEDLSEAGEISGLTMLRLQEKEELYYEC